LCQKAEKQIDLWLIFPVVLDAGKKVQSRLVNFGFDFIILGNQVFDCGFGQSLALRRA